MHPSLIRSIHAVRMRIMMCRMMMRFMMRTVILMRARTIMRPIIFMCMTRFRLLMMCIASDYMTFAERD